MLADVSVYPKNNLMESFNGVIVHGVAYLLTIDADRVKLEVTNPEQLYLTTNKVTILSIFLNRSEITDIHMNTNPLHCLLTDKAQAHPIPSIHLLLCTHTL